MKNDNPICLGAMPVGIICEIRNITSDKETERRLLELGVRIGSLVKVLNRQMNGSVVLARGEARLAVDSSLADALVVSVA